MTSPTFQCNVTREVQEQPLQPEARAPYIENQRYPLHEDAFNYPGNVLIREYQEDPLLGRSNNQFRERQGIFPQRDTYELHSGEVPESRTILTGGSQFYRREQTAQIFPSRDEAFTQGSSSVHRRQATHHLPECGTSPHQYPYEGRQMQNNFNEHNCNPMAFRRQIVSPSNHFERNRNMQLPRPGYRRDLKGLKMSSFTGEGDWNVWFAKFGVMTNRYGLDTQEKLDLLLHHIEGKAAEFVFTQLPPAVLENYEFVVQELNTRFMAIETPRLYASKFSRRTQKIGETAEEYAAELKVLYDKAHSHRDRRARNEDLVRRFLDGLRDDEIRFEVEYHKAPETIDEAVFQVVNFIQTRGRRDHSKRTQENTRRLENNELSQDMTGSQESYSETEMEDWKTVVKDLKRRLVNLENSNHLTPPSNLRDGKNKNRDIECYNCHKKGHFARECPSKQLNQRRQASSISKTANNPPLAPLNGTGPTLAAKERSN